MCALRAARFALAWQLTAKKRNRRRRSQARRTATQPASEVARQSGGRAVR